MATTSTVNESDLTEAGLRSTVSVLTARILVPLWILAGALTKLASGSAADLPAALVKWAGAAHVDLMFVLRFGVAVELAVVAVAWLVPSLARTVGIAMLTVFLPILAGDVLMGASSCGCFGAVKVHPGITLIVDVALLASLLFLGRGVPSLRLGPTLPTVRTVAAGLATIAAFAVAFGWLGTKATSATPIDASASASSAGPALPADGYYLPDYAAWIGTSYRDIELFAWVEGLPDELGTDARHVLFYRKDCEHCHELMEVWFAGPLMLPTTAIAVPERGGWPAVDLGMPCAECGLAELPPGVDWFLQTPVLVRLEDGIVTCAAEVSADEPTCLGS
jgi:hypothetical protein